MDPQADKKNSHTLSQEFHLTLKAVISHPVLQIALDINLRTLRSPGLTALGSILPPSQREAALRQLFIEYGFLVPSFISRQTPTEN